MKKILPTFLLILIVGIGYWAVLNKIKSYHPWHDLAAADLKKIYTTVKDHHPGPVDPLNTQFIQWLEDGFQQTMQKIANIDSFEGYKYALSYYITGFQDSHLDIEFEIEKKSVMWPSFLVQFKNNNFFVEIPNNQKESSNSIPPNNAQLISVNNMNPKEYMNQFVFPYNFGIPNLEADWIQLAPLMLIDDGNPWAPTIEECKFDLNGTYSTFTFSWQNIDRDQIQKLIKPEKTPEKAYLSFFDIHNVWIHLPSFYPKSEQEIAALNNVIERLKSIPKENDLIVFDLRGNSGGYGSWGDQLLHALYGAQFIESVVEPEINILREWRVTEDNLKNIQRMRSSVEKQFGKDAEDYRYLDELSNQISAKLKTGEPFAAIPEEIREKRDKSNPVASQVFVLTDSQVRSAALDFMDKILLIENTTHVGLPTKADTVYLGVRSLRLPSKIAMLYVPTHVVRNRKRGHNQPYIPTHRFEGNIQDTKQVQEWITQLNKV